MCVCFILPYYLARFSRRKLCIGAAECRGWRQTPVTNLNNPWNLEGWLVFPRFPQMLTDARRIASIAALFLVPVFARVPVEAFGKTYFFWLKHCRRTDGPWSLPALLELCDFIIFHYLVHLVQLSRGTLEPLISQCTGRWSIKVDGETRCLVCRFPGQLMPRQNYTCGEREIENMKLSSHYSVVIFRFIFQICSKIVGGCGAVRLRLLFINSNCLSCPSTRTLATVLRTFPPQLSWTQARNRKKLTLSSGHLNLNKRRVSHVSPLFAFAIFRHLSPDHCTREGSARMPTQSVSHACSLWPWRSLGQRLFDR